MPGDQAKKPLLLTNVKPIAFGAGTSEGAIDILVNAAWQDRRDRFVPFSLAGCDAHRRQGRLHFARLGRPARAYLAWRH